MTTSRERLANRRSALTFDLEVGGLAYTCTVGRFPDGRVSEVFVQNHKRSSGADVAVRDAGIILSFALQHGADFNSIRRALCRDPRGGASGVMGAVLDAIAAEPVL
jgi:hypothetical protein